jgi:hypothetical protein
MAISFTGNGGAFTILGAIICGARSINGQRGAAIPTPASLWGASGPQIRASDTIFNNIIAAHSAAQADYYDGLHSIETSYMGSQDAALGSLKTLAANELIAIVNADKPQADLNLTTAMKEFIKQMKAGAQTVLRCAVAATVTPAGSNIGNPVVLCSVTGRNGVPLEYAIAENAVGTCLGDSAGNGNGATAGNEQITIVAPLAVTATMSQTWPAGSGSTQPVTLINPNTNAGANLLTNSNFETWTVANIPDNWTILVGVVVTNVAKAVTNIFGVSSTAALQFVGQAATLTAVTQTFGAVAGSGTTADVKPGTVYGVNFNVYTDVQPAAGVLAIELTDGNDVILNDDASVANTITKNLVTMPAVTYTPVNGFFRTPTNLPAVVKIRIRLSTAMSAGSKLNIDYGAMGEPKQLYPAGPYVIAFRGAADLVYGDSWTIAVTNDRAGQFQTYFERFFGMSGMGLILPSLGAGNTINENLIA